MVTRDEPGAVEGLRAFFETGDFRPDIGEADLDFLVSVRTLVGRFWVAEARVSYRERPLEQVIGHYVRLLARHFSFFATEQGRRRLEPYLGLG